MSSRQQLVRNVAMTASISPKGNWWGAIGRDGVPYAQSLAPMKPPVRLLGHEGRAGCIAIFPSEAWALTGGEDKTFRFWDLATGKLRSTATLAGTVIDVTIAPDGKRYLTVHDLRDLPPDPAGPVTQAQRMYDTATGKLLWEKRQNGSNQTMFSPDSRWLLELDEYGSSAPIFDAATGKLVATLPGHHVGTLAGALSPDGKLAVTADWNGVIRLWQVSGGKLLCQVVSFENGDWAVVDSAGRFDCANGGDIDGLHWVVRDEPIDLAQLKVRYYEPGLLEKLLGTNSEPLRQVEALRAPQLHPDVAVTEPTPERPKLGIKLTNRGGGIGRVIVTINGKEITADARGPQAADADAATMDLLLDLPPDHPLLMPGADNVIRVTAFNTEGYLSSRGLERVYRTPAAARNPPRFFGMTVGVSDYRGDKIDLQFAAKDADNFGQAVQLAAGRLFGSDKVQVEVFSTSQPLPTRQPTRETCWRDSTASPSRPNRPTFFCSTWPATA